MEEPIFEHCYHYLLLLHDIYILIQFIYFFTTISKFTS